MIHGILENFNISWEERLGKGMKQTTNETLDNIVFRYERTNNILTVTHIKENTPVHQDIYETDNLGRLQRMTSKDCQGKIFWIYKYEHIAEGLSIKRTNPKGKILEYKFIVTDRDKEGRILSGEYRDSENTESTEKINCKRDEKENMLEETLSEGREALTFFFDEKGRYKKFEILLGEKIHLRQEYVH